MRVFLYELNEQRKTAPIGTVFLLKLLRSFLSSLLNE